MPVPKAALPQVTDAPLQALAGTPPAPGNLQKLLLAPVMPALLLAAPSGAMLPAAAGLPRMLLPAVAQLAMLPAPAGLPRLLLAPLVPVPRLLAADDALLLAMEWNTAPLQPDCIGYGLWQRRRPLASRSRHQWRRRLATAVQRCCRAACRLASAPSAGAFLSNHREGAAILYDHHRQLQTRPGKRQRPLPAARPQRWPAAPPLSGGALL